MAQGPWRYSGHDVGMSSASSSPRSESTDPSAERGRPRRRSVLGAGLVGAAGTGALTACGGGGSDSEASQDGGSGESSSAAASGGSAVTVAASKVPVGGGYVDKDAKVVLTQPTSGSFKAFTAVCPHQQCVVDQVSDNSIQCPCHGSEFDATNGDVTEGPAQSGLAAKTVRRSGSNLVVS